MRGCAFIYRHKTPSLHNFTQKIQTFCRFPTSNLSGKLIFARKKFSNKGEIIMKKFLALSILFGSAVMFVPAAEAKAATAEKIGSAIELNASSAPQWQRQRNRRWNNRRARVVIRTRIVRRGYRTYRERVQYRYLPNGRVTVRVLSRTRIR